VRITYPSVNHTTKLTIIAIIIVAFFVSCERKIASKTNESDFSSLVDEKAFWSEWISTHMPNTCPLEPFFLENDGQSTKDIDDELREIANNSKDFVLIIRVNVENCLFDIVTLSKDKNWKQSKWEYHGIDGWSASVKDANNINENVLMSLSNNSVYVDALDEFIFHADSDYVFLRFNGKCSRFAIYNPQYEDASHYYSDDETRLKIGRDPVAASLKSLFEVVEIK
jgi:hypothetical protein